MTSVLELRFLGGLHILIDGTSLIPSISGKGQALLCYLSVSGEAHSRSTLAGLLWTDIPETNARANLRKTLSRIKPKLCSHLNVTRETIAFKPEAPHWLDVADFEAGLKPGSDFVRIQEAVSLYKGDFLENFYLPGAPLFDQWVMSQRAWLRGLVLNGFQSLVTHSAYQGDFKTAILYARRLLDIEPWHESAHRELMGLLMLSGKRSAALKQYETCREILAEDLGVEPDAATKILCEQIRQGQFSKSKFSKRLSFNGSDRIEHNDIQKQAVLPSLPTLTKPLVGRQSEQAKLRDLLSQPDVRLITILGPGGIGKTHLATVFAHEMVKSGRFDNGVIFVPLTSVTTRQQFIITIANQLNQPVGSTHHPEKALLQMIRGKAHFIVLDNFEQILSVSDLLVQMMCEAPRTKFLVTSRERLRLQEEWVLDMDGLPYPRSRDKVGAAQTDAVILFAQRARQIRSDFSLEKHLASITRICQLTEGMPLALEQAASWIRTSTAEDIADQIEENINTLSTSLENVPQKHRAMRSVFDGSLRWLSEKEQKVFCALSIFQGGFTLEAGEKVADACPPILSTLIDKSLLRRGVYSENTTRYYMHELIRKYAHEKLVESSEEWVSAAYKNYLTYFLAYAERAEQFWDTAHEREWLQLLETERSNFHAALQWAHENNQTEQALRLNAALFNLWIYNSPATEASHWLDTSLRMPWDEQSPSTMRARAKALNVAGYAAIQTSDFKKATSYFEEGLALYSTLKDRKGIAWSLRGCGFVLLIRDDLTQAKDYIDRSSKICRQIHDDWGAAWSLYDLGNTTLADNDLANAQRLLEDSLERFRKKGILFGEFRALISLGHVMRSQGHWTHALDFYREAMEIQHKTHFIQFVAQVMEGIGHTAVALQDFETGVCLFAISQARRASLEMARWVSQERDYQNSLALIRAQLPENIWQAAWKEGDNMTIQEAVEFTMTLCTSYAQPSIDEARNQTMSNKRRGA